MSAERDWSERAKRFVKGELKRKGVTYEELARRLSEMGLEETKASVASKVSRGSFTAVFFLASMRAIDCQTVRIEDI